MVIIRLNWVWGPLPGNTGLMPNGDDEDLQ